MRRVPVVAAGKLHDPGAEQRRELLGAAVVEDRPRGHRAGGRDDADGRVPDVGHPDGVGDDRGEVVGDEEVEVGSALLVDRLRGQVGLGGLVERADAEHSADLQARRGQPAGQVDLLDLEQLPLVVGALGVGQQPRRDGLVGDQGAHLLRVVCRDMQPDDRAEAAAEHHRRLVGDLGQQPMDVVGVVVQRDRRRGVVERAAGQAAPVVGHHGEVGDELVDQVNAASGVALAALGDQQNRATAADFVVEGGAGNPKCRRHATDHTHRIRCIQVDVSN